MKKYSHYVNEDDTNNVNKDLSNNTIIYGINESNNYCYALKYLKEFSKSQLKYSRKIAVEHDSEETLYNISDIHIEVDFDLLGVGEYSKFLDIFNHVKDNVACNKEIFFIVCLNFHCVKRELLDIFYTFLNEECIRFVFLTKKLSFICDNIFKRAKIKKVSADGPTKIGCNIDENIRRIADDISANQISLFLLRESIYKLLVLNINIHDCMQRLFGILIETEYICLSSINLVLKEYIQFVKKFNNNYRPIYHIESFILFLINLKDSKHCV